MDFFLPFADPLENVGGEIVVLEIVQAVLDHLAEVEGLAASSLSGEVFQSLLGFRGKSDGSGHKAIVEILVFMYHKLWTEMRVELNPTLSASFKRLSYAKLQ